MPQLIILLMFKLFTYENSCFVNFWSIDFYWKNITYRLF